MTPDSTVDQRIEALLRAVAELRNQGQPVDATALPRQVADLCRTFEALPLEQLRGSRPLLRALIEALNRLQDDIEQQYQALLPAADARHSNT